MTTSPLTEAREPRPPEPGGVPSAGVGSSASAAPPPQSGATPATTPHPGSGDATDQQDESVLESLGRSISEIVTGADDATGGDPTKPHRIG